MAVPLGCTWDITLWYSSVSWSSHPPLSSPCPASIILLSHLPRHLTPLALPITDICKQSIPDHAMMGGRSSKRKILVDNDIQHLPQLCLSVLIPNAVKWDYAVSATTLHSILYQRYVERVISKFCRSPASRCIAVIDTVNHVWQQLRSGTRARSCEGTSSSLRRP